MDNLELARTQEARHIQLIERNHSGELVGKSVVSPSGGGPGVLLVSTASGEEEELNSEQGNMKYLAVTDSSASVSLRACFGPFSFFDQVKLRTTQGRAFWEIEFQLRHTDTSYSQHTMRRTCRAKEQEMESSDSRQECGPEVQP